MRYKDVDLRLLDYGPWSDAAAIFLSRCKTNRRRRYGHALARKGCIAFGLKRDHNVQPLHTQEVISVIDVDEKAVEDRAPAIAREKR